MLKFLPRSLSFFVLLALIAFQQHACKFSNDNKYIEASANPDFIDKKFEARNYVQDDPVQENLNETKPIIMGEYIITPKAKYTIEGMILGKHWYRDEYSAHLSSLDLAIGWGFMSNPDFVKTMSFEQSGRFLYWKKLYPSTQYPYDWDQITSHASNNHIIAADPLLNFKLEYLNIGDVVKLKGYLVYVDGRYNPGWYWHSSLSRTDKGDHACEVFYVQSVEIEKP